MADLNNKLGNLERETKIQVLLILILVILAFAGAYVSYNLGYNQKEIEVLKNAKRVIVIGNNCYTDQDIEIIVFGESQL